MLHTTHKEYRRNWSPLPLADAKYFGKHGNLIYACSDTLRRFCESLWYSGLEYKRPTDEEILAKCGILFHQAPIPSYLMYAFFYQLDNLFTMSKVVHTIRSITDWLDATENRAFQVLSVYEMHTQIPNFLDALVDRWKALNICQHILPHLGSIYHRVQPLGQGELMVVKAIIDFQANHKSRWIRTNQNYAVENNRNFNLWQLSGSSDNLIPSLFLEASTESGELAMLQRLQSRFEEFLVMCHGRTRRHLEMRLSRQLKVNTKFATLPTSDVTNLLYKSLSPMEGHYFAKSTHPHKRWRSFSNTKILCRQPASVYSTLSEDFSSPATIRRMMARLQRWLRGLPVPGRLLSERNKLQSVKASRRNMSLSSELFEGDELVKDVHKWWSVASLFVPDPTEIDRIVEECYFLKCLNDVMQMTVDIAVERNHMIKCTKLSTLRSEQADSAPGFTHSLLEELDSHLGEAFYHPRSGRTSYRWVQKSIDRSRSSSPPPVYGPELFTEVKCPIISI